MSLAILDTYMRSCDDFNPIYSSRWKLSWETSYLKASELATFSFVTRVISLGHMMVERTNISLKYCTNVDMSLLYKASVSYWYLIFSYFKTSGMHFMNTSLS